MKNKRLIIIVVVAIGLLFIPFIGTLFDTGIQWKPSDFFVAAAFLLGVGLAIELVVRKVTKKKHRIILIGTILIISILIWCELAVGIVDTIISGN